MEFLAALLRAPLLGRGWGRAEQSAGQCGAARIRWLGFEKFKEVVIRSVRDMSLENSLIRHYDFRA